MLENVFELNLSICMNIDIIYIVTMFVFNGTALNPEATSQQINLK